MRSKMTTRFSSIKRIGIGFSVLFFLFGIRVDAQEIEYGWDEEEKAEGLQRKVSTAISVYAKPGNNDATIEEGIFEGVEYAILRVNPNGDTVVQVDYNGSLNYINNLKDNDLINSGYAYVGGINAGYFNMGTGRPTGMVRQHSEWASFQGESLTPAYGSGFASAYLRDNNLFFRYHGWLNGAWLGDDMWAWWRGYNISATSGVSGSYTFFVNGNQEDITGGSSRYVNYGRALSILAQKEDKQFLLINFYGTMSDSNIISFLSQLNVKNAIRLDGGLSTSMVFEDTLVKRVDPELAYTKVNPEDLNKDVIGSVVVNVDGLSIRKDATTSSSRIGYVKYGKTHKVYETKNNEGYTWMRIGRNRWIAGTPNWVTYTPNGQETVSSTPTPEVTVEEETTSTKSLRVLVENLRIRSTPNTSGAILGYVKYNKEYEYYESQSDGRYTWYRIGEGQWIASLPNWVELKDGAASTPSTPATSTTGKVTVNVNLLSIRSSYTTSSNRLGYVDYGTTYDVYEAKDNEGYTWYRIGENRWIAGNPLWVTYTNN